MRFFNQMEEFSRAYVLAVAAAVGCVPSFRTQDSDSVDLTLHHDSGCRPSLDIQLKATAQDIGDGGDFPFDLSLKNYDDLRADTLAPRILVVVHMPSEQTDWVDHSPERLLLRNCGYWASLAGQPPTTNAASVRVRVSKQQQFTPPALRAMMDKIEEDRVL